MENKDFRKIKKTLEGSSETFDKVKGLLGAPDMITPKNPFDFENKEDFENFCSEYIKKYRIEITEFANYIFLANERVNITKEEIGELYSILVSGFPAFLFKKRFEDTDNIKKVFSKNIDFKKTLK